MKKKNLLTTLLLLMVSICTVYGQAGNGTEVTMQGFHWESKNFDWYNIVNNHAADLADSQIDAIWMPPPSDAASPDGYLPRRLYRLDNSYGTEAQQRAMINSLHNHGVKVIADIVINHRVGTTGWGDFTEPEWGCWAVVHGDSWPGACGNHDTGSHYDPARDLDHTNETVRNDLKAWMNWLKNDVGYDGWRYDYVHGFAAHYIKEYNDATNPWFSVGELWDGNTQNVINWIDGTQGASTAFDFPLKYILHRAVEGGYWELNNGGQAPGVIGAWPQRAVTFIDNHDTGSTQAYSPFPSNHIMQGYAYILTHPGSPMVFWEHYYDWGLYDQIKALIKIRKDNGLHHASQINIQKSDDAYAAIIDGKVAMKIGPGNWSPSGSGWILKTYGNNYAVWDQLEGDSGNQPGEPSENVFTVHFKKPSGWGNNIRVHHWGAQPSGAIADSNWPGVQMTAEGDDWFSFTFNNVDQSNLLFHDNNGNQTDDLARGTNGWYENGVWLNDDPRGGGNEPEPGDGFEVYFRQPAGWASSIRVHHWGASPVGSLANSSWPGVAMINEGGGWYKFVFNNINSTNLLFHDNNGNQTLDLTRDRNGWYDNGTWHDSDPRGGGANGLTIHFHTNWSNPHMHYWNITPTGAAPNTTWPGASMAPEGNGWYVYTIDNAECANIVFNNGGSPQTADLFRCGEGWYINGAWHNQFPGSDAQEQDASVLNGDYVLDLGQNFPNPFDEATTISFSLSKEGSVNLIVYNMLGNPVADLAKGNYKAGIHEVELSSSGLSSGIYIYALSAEGKTIRKRMVVK
jgi:alpha-amylase